MRVLLNSRSGSLRFNSSGGSRKDAEVAEAPVCEAGLSGFESRPYQPRTRSEVAEIECYLCKGGEREVTAVGSDGEPYPIVCPECHGRGTKSG